ncbi:hypothetical protein B0H34DRAFT_227411 [Crassisporium funariophilum]|nr:hypothetical protein B0H34DRAFT_227411 [Crassisporium funariophilum]
MFYENIIESSQPMREPVPIAQDRVGVYFEQLRGEIINIMETGAASRETIRRLETELGVYKRAYADLDAERQRFERLKQEADKQKEDLENQLKGHRITALLDGDGAIFNSQLISQGLPGGHIAARMLSDSIIQHLVSTNGSNHYQLWVYVFLNKRGLMDTLGRFGFASAKVKFEEFVTGFNQAAERFIMVDVGSAKEAADAKIKVLLEDEIKLPQTEKIIFGGCHDNGYATTLRSQITAGFKHKLILLRGYTENAAGIDDLELPSFGIPDLFMPEKLGSGLTAQNHPPTQTLTTIPNSRSSLPVAFPGPVAFPVPVALPVPASLPAVVDAGLLPKADAPVIEQVFDALPFASVERFEVNTPKLRPSPPSYSSAVQTPPKRVITPELDSSGSITSSDGSDDSLPLLRPSLTGSRSRLVNPNLPLLKHKPPPCTLFYLSNCKHGSECKYAHDYLLQAEQFDEIRVNAKKSPCPSRNKGEICLWGDDCCYGHNCPLTTKCHYLKQGRCKFVGADMHKELKAQPLEMA